MERLNVICFLWGQWPEIGWGHEYVRRLYHGVQRNLSYPHRFVCYTDVICDMGEGIEVRLNPFSYWPGCLPKLFAYSPDASLKGRTLILDLDNVIVGSLDKMADYSGPLAVRAWFKGYDQGKKVPDGDMISFEAGSDYAKKIWLRAVKDPVQMIEDTGGRERYFLRDLPRLDLWQDVLGAKSILSYKNHVRGGRKIPKETCIISCHDGGGRQQTCRPHQLKEDFIREHWR